MTYEQKTESLLEVCRRYREDAPENVLFDEPYLPYIPENWNGILVLAESQVIRSKDKYAEWLEKKLTPTQRMTRLGRKEPTPPYEDQPDKIGVGPWDDGTIKLALQAIFEGANPKLKLEEVAVSNAVPWTRKSTGKNLRPDAQMKAKAAKFWGGIFDVWQPDIKALVVLGNFAEEVMKQAKILEKYRVLKLRLPSPNVIDRVRGMFSCDDLEIRFPEVKKAREYLGISKDKRKIFFACHAVSLGVSKFKECFDKTNK